MLAILFSPQCVYCINIIMRQSEPQYSPDGMVPHRHPSNSDWMPHPPATQWKCPPAGRHVCWAHHTDADGSDDGGPLGCGGCGPQAGSRVWKKCFIPILSSPGAEARIFCNNWVKTIVVDDLLVPCITRLCFYQTRSAWSMDQGSTRKHSAVHNFAPTVMKFCVMWEGLSLPHDTKFGNCRGEIVDRRMIFIWSLIYGSGWTGLIKAEPGHQQPW